MNVCTYVSKYVYCTIIISAHVWLCTPRSRCCSLCVAFLPSALAPVCSRLPCILASLSTGHFAWTSRRNICHCFYIIILSYNFSSSTFKRDAALPSLAFPPICTASARFSAVNVLHSQLKYEILCALTLNSPVI